MTIPVNHRDRIARYVLCAVAALLMFVSPAAFAGRWPNEDWGFHPDRLYDFHDVDSINKHNGNLLVTLPIGPRYQVSSTLSYQLTLIYNSKLWDLESWDCEDTNHNLVRCENMYPSFTSNAGLGWRLSLGQLLPPTEPEPLHDSLDRPDWLYVGPSGDEHTFPAQNDDSDPILESEATGLRLRRVSANIREIEFQSGEVHRFVKIGNLFRLTQMRDRFGNEVTIGYGTSATTGGEMWTISDSHSRQHTIEFLNSKQPYKGWELPGDVRFVTLQGVSGAMKYTFELKSFSEALGVPVTGPGSGFGAVPLLTGLTLPDDTKETFEYYPYGTNVGFAQLKKLGFPTGGSITYTYTNYTLGWNVCYDGGWGSTSSPTAAAGVWTRTVFDGKKSRQWDYVQRRGPGIQMNSDFYGSIWLGQCGLGKAPREPHYWSRTSILEPVDENGKRVRTDYYFNIFETDYIGAPLHPLFTATYRDHPGEYSGPGPYGMPPEDTARGSLDVIPENDATYPADIPAHDPVTTDGKRLILTRLYSECDSLGDCTHGQLLRTTYAEDPVFHNIRMALPATERVVFHDDKDCDGAECYKLVWRHDDNYAGRYRTIDEKSNFPGSQDVKTKTSYPLWTTADLMNPEKSWIFDVYDERTRTEGSGSTATVKYKFDANTGALEAVRTVKEDGLGGDDLLTIFGRDDNGNVIQEKSYGGDGAGLGTLSCCDAPSAAPAYLVKHDYTAGRLSKSQYIHPGTCTDVSQTTCGSVLTTTDLTLDSSTGAVRSSRDPAGNETSYAYDDKHRLKKITSPTQATWNYAYTQATSSSNARVTETVKDAQGAVSTTATYEYDGLGRIIRVSKSLPRGKFAVVDTDYDQNGRPYRVSQPVESSSHPSTSVGLYWTTSVFDAFDRPTSVTAPDDSQTLFTYTGVRKLARTVKKVATGIGVFGDAKTNEYYDAGGRLTKVEENAGGPTDQVVTTAYAYDVGGRLARVEMAAPQPARTFTYDRRGFLKEESHPESGTTHYFDYDARGHATTTTTGVANLGYEYDKAERLTSVLDRSENDRPLKTFEFDAQPAAGRLLRQTRYNYIDDTTGDTTEGTVGGAVNDPSYDVTDEFHYDDAGRVDTKTTTIALTTVDAGPQTNEEPTIFEQKYDLNDFDQQKTFRFPTCSGCGALVLPARTPLAIGYDAGFMTSIAGVTGDVDPEDAAHHGVGITYGASGQPHKIRHAAATGPGVLDTYELDPHGMARPSRITFSNANDCKLITAQPVTMKVVEYGKALEFKVTTVDDATVTWYEGACCKTDKPAGTTGKTLSIASLTKDALYWAQVSAPSSSCTQNSDTFIATVCRPADIVSPPEFTGSPIPTKPGATLYLSASVSGTNYRVRWHRKVYDSNGNTIANEDIPGAVTSSVSVIAPESGKADYSIIVTTPGIDEDSTCASSASRLIHSVEIIPPAAACPLDVLSHFPPSIEFWPGRFIPVLSLAIIPEPSTQLGLETKGIYYRWYMNGALVREGLQDETPDPNSPTGIKGVPGIDKFTAAANGATITVNAWRICPASISPSVSFTTFVYNPDDCPKPPISVQQIDLGGGRIQLHADSVWPYLHYQWYRGDSGNTRFPLDATADLTIAGAASVWVRATSVCGSTADSPTIVLSYGGCMPVQFAVQPQSAQVQANVPHTLSAAAFGNPPPTQFTWYEVTDGPASVIAPESTNASSYSAKPKRTTSYWVKAASSCISADSRLATLQVVSCSDITVTQPPQSASINEGQSATLSVVAGSPTGKSLTYQWYRGESGDTSNRIDGAVAATQAFTPSVTTKYWVRIIASTCEIDVPTTTVYVCRKPVATGYVKFYESYAPAQRHWLDAWGTGDNLNFQWYIGTPGDTSTPVQPLNTRSIQVLPAVTTRYWFRVTSDCYGTTPDKYDDSDQILVTVCPVIRTQPSIQYPEVMSGASARITLEASGAEGFQWYRGNSGDTSNPVTMTLVSSSADTYVFETPAITGPVSFWAAVKSGLCERATEAVSIDTCHLPTVTWGPGYKTQIASGESQLLSVWGTVTGDYERKHTWYSGPQAGNLTTSTKVNGGGPLDVQYQTPGLTQTTSYWVRLEEGNGCYADTTLLTIQVCIPTITTGPQSITINSGESTTLSVAANGGPLTYQWYVGQPGDVSAPVAGQTTPSLPVTGSTTKTYWVRVTGSCNISRDSAAATVTVCAPPQLNGQPLNQTLYTAAQTVNLYVSATGTDLEYQWYNGASPNISSPITNATQSSVTVSGLSTSDYWVKVTGRCGTVNSNTVKVSVPPTITTQPAGGYVMPGTTRTLSVVATGNQLAYQWYSGTSTLINGATGASYTPPAVTADTTYWVRVFSGNASKDSDPVTLTVCTQPTIGWNAAKTQITLGESQILSVSTTFGDPNNERTFTWYQGDSGNVAGSTVVSGGSTQFSTPGLTAATKYWVRINEGPTCYADTPTLTITVCVPTITTQPLSQTINSGQTATLTVAANTAPLTYQWYRGDSGDTTNLISGATSATFTTPALTATTKYWVRVTNSTCSVQKDSATATVSICAPAQITGQPLNQTLSYPTTYVTLNVTASGNGLTYQWYSGASPNTANPISGATQSSIQVSGQQTADYWVKVTGSCGSANSNTVKVSIPPTINTQPASATVMPNTTAVLSVSASGPQLSYQWYSGTSTLITGATSSTYTTPPITSNTTYWVRVFSGLASKDSDPALITLCTQPTIGWSSTKSQITQGESQLLTVSATVGNPNGERNYIWYEGDSGNVAGSTVIQMGASTVQYQTPALTSTKKYWVRITEASGCYADTPTLTVSVCVPTITAQPQSTTIYSATNVTLSVTANGGPLTYQWYAGQGGNYSALAGQTASTVTVAPAVTTTYFVRVTGSCGVSRDSAVATVTVSQTPPPVMLGATYNAATGNNDVSWQPPSSSISVIQYVVERLPGGTTFYTTGTQITDQYSVVAGAAYVYRVKAVYSNGVHSDWSARDLVVRRTFADDPIRTPNDNGGTWIRGVHVAELRAAVDAVRAAAGLSPAWGSYAAPTGLIPLAHFTELRDRLNDARRVLLLPDVVFTDSVVPGEWVRARSMNELRNGVK